MIHLEIPIELLNTSQYWKGGSMLLKPELKEWLALHAPSASVFLGIVWQYVIFADEATAVLAKLTWGLTLLPEHGKIVDIRC